MLNSSSSSGTQIRVLFVQSRCRIRKGHDYGCLRVRIKSFLEKCRENVLLFVPIGAEKDGRFANRNMEL